MPDHVAASVSRRDFNTCQFCGFHADRHLGAVSPPTDEDDYDSAVTACYACEHVLDLALLEQQRSGILVWMPEIAQADLNRLMPSLYAARISVDGRSRAQVRAVLNLLPSRREQARERFGSDQPGMLVERVRRAASGALGAEPCPHASFAEGLRIWPLDRLIVREGDLEINRFPQMLYQWRSKDGIFGSNKVDCHAETERLVAALHCA